MRRPTGGSVLKRHGRDLTADAAEGRLDPLIGRQDVMERALQVGGVTSG
jgi:ATP-dependent Clp protease ATP-binding subunit ClpA